MEFVTTQINESPVISAKAGAELSDIRGCAVKFDENGGVVPAGAGETAIGIAIITNDENILKNGDVDIQIRAIGLVKAGVAVKAGDALAPDANGALVPAASGVYIAIALQEAVAAGEFVKALITHGSH